MFKVYILYSRKLNKYYTGQTNDSYRRVNQHIKKQNLGADDWVLKYSEEFPDRATACRRELEIKKNKSIKYIESLISSAG